MKCFLCLKIIFELWKICLKKKIGNSKSQFPKQSFVKNMLLKNNQIKNVEK